MLGDRQGQDRVYHGQPCLYHSKDGEKSQKDLRKNDVEQDQSELQANFAGIQMTVRWWQWTGSALGILQIHSPGLSGHLLSWTTFPKFWFLNRAANRFAHIFRLLNKDDPGANPGPMGSLVSASASETESRAQQHIP